MRFERQIEALLWSSRFLVIVPVVLSLVAAIAMLYMATADSIYLAGSLTGYGSPHLSSLDREHLRDSAIASVAAILDGYLFGAVLIIFALGLYELFISKIDAAEQSEVAPRLLLIRNLDDLKERLGKVIFLILVVRYFQFALQSELHTGIDLLMLAVGIALIALSLYLTSAHAKRV
jgi:uncharacterized membrane protein YqhA